MDTTHPVEWRVAHIGFAEQDIWFKVMGDVSPPQKFLATRLLEHSATLSPGGRRVAYVSEGSLQVYVREFPSGQGRQQVSVSAHQENHATVRNSGGA